MEEGVFIESINYASLKKLPIVFSCEDNGLAIFTRKHQRTPPTKYVERVASWDLLTLENSYRNPLQLIETTKSAIDHSRNSEPVFMVTECYRWLEHVGVGTDWDLGYRDASELSEWKKYDVEFHPEILNLEASLVEKINISVEKKIDELFSLASKASDADASDLMRNVY